MYYVKLRNAAGEWHWLLYAANHKVISRSSEGYWNEADCDRSIALNKQSRNAPVYRS